MKNCRKKNRDSNFSSSEIDYLLDCITPHINMIENKKIDSFSLQAKKKLWDSIVELFDYNPNCHSRTRTQLEIKWKSLKQAAKKQLLKLQEFANTESTGSDPPDFPDCYKRVFELLGSRFAQIPLDANNDELLNGKLETSEIEDNDSDVRDVELNSRLTAAVGEKDDHLNGLFAEPVSQINVLPSYQGTSMVESLKKFDQEKRNLLDLQMEHLKTEHALKVKFMEAEHEYRMEAIREEVRASQAKARYFNCLRVNRSSAP